MANLYFSLNSIKSLKDTWNRHSTANLFLDDALKKVEQH